MLQIGSKSVKQCVQFYYLWKKVCNDEYKRLRILRRKREQDELYNLRSKAAQDAKDKDGTPSRTPSPKPGVEENEDGTFTCDFPECRAVSVVVVVVVVVEEENQEALHVQLFQK